VHRQRLVEKTAAGPAAGEIAESLLNDLLANVPSFSNA